MSKEFMPLDTIHEIACGVDIHKKFLIAVICDESMPGNPVYFKNRFSLFTKNLHEFKDWLIEHHCYHVCMESTGKYWIPAFNILEPAMKEVRIVNPKWVKQIRGEKDDQKDAVLICNKYRHGETKASYIPCKDIRDGRQLTRTMTKLTQQRTTILNRINGALFASNYRLDMVFSSISTRSAQKIIRLLIDDQNHTNQEFLACVHKRCRASREDILSALDGIPFSKAEKVRLRILVRQLEDVEENIKNIQKAINELYKEMYAEIIICLCTVPGIGKIAAQKILSEIGPDMSYFSTPSKLARWAGLAQDQNESADRKYSNRIGQGGKYLKPIMVQCAWAAVKSKNPYYLTKFNNIASRRGRKRAIIAIARKMLVSIWAMLTYGEEWKPMDMNEKNGCPRGLDIQIAKSKLNNAVSALLSLGKTESDIRNELTEIIQTQPKTATV